ncbi:MAG TPA: hypothetical protein VJ965_10120 [Anaerolineales bacterium]|nr:hypothetical protein [Anaerolineales bacterium]
MDPLFEFLNQPIVLTLVSLIVGSYLLSLVAERRSRQNSLRDKAVDFLTEAADTIKSFVPLIYRTLRTGSLAVDEEIQDGLTTLFASRMRIQVGSQAYLKTDDFALKFFDLLEELSAVMQFMVRFEQGEEQEAVLQEVKARRQNLIAEWPLKDEEHPPSSGTPIDELIWLMDLILHRTTDLLTVYLDETVG